MNCTSLRFKQSVAPPVLAEHFLVICISAYEESKCYLPITLL